MNDWLRKRKVNMGVPVIDQAKIQAQVLVPLVKALQAEHARLC